MAYLVSGGLGTSVTSHAVAVYSGEIGHVKGRFTAAPNVWVHITARKIVILMNVQVSTLVQVYNISSGNRMDGLLCQLKNGIVIEFRRNIK